MKAQLKFLRPFYSPLHKKTFEANSSIEILVENGIAVHSFWYVQLKDDANEEVDKKYFEIVLPENTNNSKPKK